MTTAPQAAPKAAKTKTAYHVLKYFNEPGNEGAPKYELLSMDVPANNASHAIITFLNERSNKPANGRYVAIPSRSWKELPAAIETATVVKVGDA
jgi:hypothetical protein